MKNRLIAFALYSLFWLLFFVIARLVFILMQFTELTLFSSDIIPDIFLHGIKSDLSTTGYFLIIPVLASIPGLFFTAGWYKILIRVYSLTLILICSALVLGDAIVYSYWGFRLEFFIMEYLKTPADAAASATTRQVILFFFTLVAMAGLFGFLFNKLINRYFSQFSKSKSPHVSALLLLLITASLIIPIRGGFRGPPLNAGSAYFSKSLFPDHAASNIVWNFGYSAVNYNSTSNPYNFIRSPEAVQNVKMLTEDNGPAVKILKSDRPNILIMILESFGSSISGLDSNDTTVTPRFRELIPEGVYFSRMYAAGSRTEKALPAIFSGYPNLPARQIIMETEKTRSMPGLIILLDSAGYKTSFWYGGDINFANVGSYIRNSAFREIITLDNFKPEDRGSKWGVHDDILFNVLLDSLSESRQPFAYSVLTLSSHEPFKVPMEPVFKGRDVLTLFKNSIYYTDKSLGQFISRAKKTEWWKNTLVILVADHGRRNSVNTPVYSGDIFKIPMLWTGGALEVNNLIIKKLGNQYDIPLTVARQLNMKSNFPFSKDLLSDSTHSFSFYTYHEGFAFFTDTSSAIYDIRLKGNVAEQGNNPSSAEKLGKSFLQVLFDDYLKR